MWDLSFFSLILCPACVRPPEVDPKVGHKKNLPRSKLEPLHSRNFVPTFFEFLYFTVIQSINFRNLFNFSRQFAVKNASSVHSQPEVWFDQNFSTLWYNKNLIKSTILKTSKTLSLHNNNSQKLLTNCKKNSINKQAFLIFVFNELVDFSEYVQISSEFSYDF